MTKNGIVWLALLVIIAVSLMVYSTYFYKLSNFQDQHIVRTEAVDCWIYSNGWEPIVEQFQQEHPDVRVNVRLFNSYEDLNSELLAAVSAGRAPMVVELDSTQGYKSLADAGILRPAHEYAELPSDILQAADTAFLYRGKRWAVPAGVAVPVLFYNQDRLNWMGFKLPLKFRDLSSLGTTLRARTEELSKLGSNIEQQEILAADDELSFIFLNLLGNAEQNIRKDSFRNLLNMWRGLVYESAVMEPLKHRLAVSKFMTGQTWFLIANSTHIHEFDRYIAGKFAYSILPLPGAAAAMPFPRVSAFAVVAGSETSAYAGALAEYFAAPAVQNNMISLNGYMPIRRDVLEKQISDPSIPEKYNRLLQIGSGLKGQTFYMTDQANLEHISEMLMRLEGDPEDDLEQEIEEMLWMLP